MSELANNKSIRKEVDDLGETLGIKPEGKNNQQKIRSIGEQASDGTYATKEYVNTLMSGALKRSIVETLPVEDIDTNTIYMVLDETATSGNVYNEYLYINNAWELIGSTAVSGGTKYYHQIVVKYAEDPEDTWRYSLLIGTDNNTPLTVSYVWNYIKDNYNICTLNDSDTFLTYDVCSSGEPLFNEGAIIDSTNDVVLVSTYAQIAYDRVF